MATFSTPLPAPVKNDWLPTGENPRLSPPSPGGPRKNAPVQQVRLAFVIKMITTINFIRLRVRWEIPLVGDHLLLQQLEDQRQQFQTDQEVI